MPKYVADEVIREKDYTNDSDYSYRGNVLFFENGSTSYRDAVDYEYEYFSTPEEAEAWAIKTAKELNLLYTTEHTNGLTVPLIDGIIEEHQWLAYYQLQLSFAESEDEIAFWVMRINAETGYKYDY